MELSKNKTKAISAILNPDNKTIKDIARACKLSETTIYQYRKDPDFKKALQEEQNRMLAVSSAVLADGTLKAVKYLLNLIDDEKASVTNKRLSCVSIIDMAHKYGNNDLSDRISQLEKEVFQ